MSGVRLGRCGEKWVAVGLVCLRKRYEKRSPKSRMCCWGSESPKV